MGLITLSLNTLVLTTLLYHVLTYHKNKSTRTTNKNHPYVFILMSLLLSSENVFSVLRRFTPWCWMKYTFVFLLCFPGSTLGHKLYKEYLGRGCDKYGERMEMAVAECAVYVYGYVQVYINVVVDFVNGWMKRKVGGEVIELQCIQEAHTEIVKNE